METGAVRVGWVGWLALWAILGAPSIAGTLKGRATIDKRNALPPAASQPPIPFIFDHHAITPWGRYALQAGLRPRDQEIFRSDAFHSAVPGTEGKPVQLMLRAELPVSPNRKLVIVTPPPSASNFHLTAIPAEITSLEKRARGLYQQGETLKALEMMQQVMTWVDAKLPEGSPYRARAQSWTALLLNAVGRPEEGLPRAQESLRTYRNLSKTDPAYLPDLARTLNILSVSYGALGRRYEALKLTEEAIQISRGLTKTNPAYLPELAMSLNSLGSRYSKIGRSQEALPPIKEAVKINRDLAQNNPVFLIDLASSLNNLGNHYSELGRRQEAQLVKEEALMIQRALAKSNPIILNESLRIQGISLGTKMEVTPSNLSFLPKGDPDTSLRRSVLKLQATFAGEKDEIPQLGTAFVVKRQGDRAWIATARHVVFARGDYRPAVEMKAEIYTGPLPDGLLPPRLEVVMPSLQRPPEGDDLIILEVRGLPEDVQPLALTTATPSGVLKVVGHPTNRPPWSVLTFPVVESDDEKRLYLRGQLEEGGSGSPVLNGAGQVVGIVVRGGGFVELSLVAAYRIAVLQAMMP